jgi:hypothetical protein
MGDELLESSAKFGDFEKLESCLKLKANPCQQGMSLHTTIFLVS